MAQLNIRIDDDSRGLFDSLARARGLSTSDLMRDLIDQAVGKRERPRDDTTPASLSALDRRILGLHHEILAALNADDEDQSAYHLQMVEILNRGFTAEYHKTFTMIQPEMTSRECNLVHDILQMFTMIKVSVSKLSEKARTSLGEHADYALTFSGFDFNDPTESRLASYAGHVVNDGRWREVAESFDHKHEGGNSHIPMLATYQRMLTAWKPIWAAKTKTMGGPSSYVLTSNELQRIAAAWPYPKNHADAPRAEAFRTD